VKIEVRVSTNSKQSEVINVDGMYRVKLKSKPHDNLANIELIGAISKHFKISKTSVKILRGLKSRSKLVGIITK